MQNRNELSKENNSPHDEKPQKMDLNTQQLTDISGMSNEHVKLLSQHADYVKSLLNTGITTSQLAQCKIEELTKLFDNCKNGLVNFGDAWACKPKTPKAARPGITSSFWSPGNSATKESRRTKSIVFNADFWKPDAETTAAVVDTPSAPASQNTLKG